MGNHPPSPIVVDADAPSSETMSAVIIEAYGGPKTMKRVTVRRPPPPKGSELLVKVYAASLNPIDYKRRQGDLKAISPDTFPYIPGYDFAGVVEAVGPDVTTFESGDKVFGRLGSDQCKSFGTLAEYTVILEDHAAAMPTNVSFEEAAAVPLAGLTAMQCFDRGSFSKGGYKSALIPAGGGGVGHLAIQLAKHMYKADRIVTTASAAKAEFVKELGATQVIDYKKEKMTEVLKDDPVDFVLDTTGEALDEISVTREGGYVCSISTLPDKEEVTQKVGNPGFLVGMYLNSSASKFKKAANARKVGYSYLFMNASGTDLAKIGKLMQKGKVKAHLDEATVDSDTYTLDDFAEAFAHLEGGRTQGKVVVTVRNDDASSTDKDDSDEDES